MRRRPRRLQLIGVCALATMMLASGLGSAAPTRKEQSSGYQLVKPRHRFPEDRYAMAGGCYAIRSGSRFIQRGGDGFVATARSLGAAEPFHFQATDLGRYLLFGTSEDFLAASEGLLGEAAYSVTENDQVSTAGGVVSEETDRTADTVADSELNEASGRGETVVAAGTAGELADWSIEQTGGKTFSLDLRATDQSLVVANDGELTLFPEGESSPFSFERVSGCASFPEIEVNVSGPAAGGETSFQEVRGYMESHLHMMAFEFLGGRVHCGRPWHPYGVAHALVDCPDHEPGGHGAVLEALLAGGDPVTGHNTDGWPTFEGWPTFRSYTHEQTYYKWVERAWRGGLRMFVNLLVDNNQLCKVYPFRRNSCNEMDGVRLQARRIHQLEAYIDAQEGGPGEGWFRIVDDPFEARRVINEGKLAVILGIEVSVPLDCGLTLDMPRCDLKDVRSGLDEVYDLGVRQMELTNKFDNAFTGVAGDAGEAGIVVNQGNKGDTGNYWRMETCTEDDGHAHDKLQSNFHDESGAPPELTGRDSLAGGIFALTGTSGQVPLYPEGPHCNILGLSELGEAMIKGMVKRGIIVDPDHMSARAQTQALDLLETLDHPGIVSSHSWSNDTIYPRIWELGGVVGPHADGSEEFVEDWRQHRRWADDRYLFGLAFGADTNGFSAHGGPRGEDAKDPVVYPFKGLGGAIVGRQQSGSQTYDINVDGVAHYGLYPDWMEDLRRLAGDEIIRDMARGSEAYLQMWERAIGIAPDACRRDVPDLSDARLSALHTGMSWVGVLRTVGQPHERTSAGFRYCMSEGRSAHLTFDTSDKLTGWNLS